MFSERLRMLREERGLSQNDVAKFIGLNKTTISYYENGREPDYKTLKTLAKYFGVTSDYLIGLSNNRELTDKDIVLRFLDSDITTDSNRYINTAIILEAFNLAVNAFPFAYEYAEPIEEREHIKAKSGYLSMLSGFFNEISSLIFEYKELIINEFKTVEALDDNYFKDRNIPLADKFKYININPEHLKHNVYIAVHKKRSDNHKNTIGGKQKANIEASIEKLLYYVFDYYYNICKHNFTGRATEKDEIVAQRR